MWMNVWWKSLLTTTIVHLRRSSLRSMDDDDSVEYAFRSFFPLKPCLPLYISPSIQRRRFTLVERAFCELCRVRISRWMDGWSQRRTKRRSAGRRRAYLLCSIRAYIYTTHTHTLEPGGDLLRHKNSRPQKLVESCNSLLPHFGKLHLYLLTCLLPNTRPRWRASLCH